VARHDTIKNVIAPVVLVVGAPPDLVELCSRAARTLELEVLPTEVERAAQVAAEYRPFAIVMPDWVYEDEPAEHEALAKDVGARIVRVSDRLLPIEALEALLYGRLLESSWRRSP